MMSLQQIKENVYQFNLCHFMEVLVLQIVVGEFKIKIIVSLKQHNCIMFYILEMIIMITLIILKLQIRLLLRQIHYQAKAKGIYLSPF